MIVVGDLIGIWNFGRCLLLIAWMVQGISKQWLLMAIKYMYMTVTKMESRNLEILSMVVVKEEEY